MKRNQWNVFNKVVGSDIHRILLYGVAGTGKTTSACKTATNGHYNITVHEDSSVADILGMWIPKGKEFKWQDGVAIKAWTEGKLLVINEIDHASGAVLTKLLAILDDISVAHLALPNGKVVKPHKDFKIIATMNGDLSDLPTALVDRFDLRLEIDLPHPKALEKLDEQYRTFIENEYKSKRSNVSFREMLAFQKLRAILGDSAFEVVFGKVGKDVKHALQLGTRGKK